MEAVVVVISLGVFIAYVLPQPAARHCAAMTPGHNPSPVILCSRSYHIWLFVFRGRGSKVSQQRACLCVRLLPLR